MTVTPSIFDWPSLIVPINQIFYAGGSASEALYTTGGVANYSPEPGGNGYLQMEFNYAKDDRTSRLVSWLMSKVANGNIFRIPIRRSVQLFSPAALTLEAEIAGTVWENGAAWETGYNWAVEPTALVTVAALEGEVTLTFDMGMLGANLEYGHILGIGYGNAHMVEDISYVGTVATATISPPLRRDMAINAVVSFRPFMLATCENPENLRAVFEAGKWVRPGGATFMEAIV